MPLEPSMLPTNDVAPCTGWIRAIAWVTLLLGVVGGAAMAYGGYKAENWTTVGIGAGMAVGTVLTCLLVLAFAANSENLMAIARGQEISNSRLLDIKKAVEKQTDPSRESRQA